MEFIQSERGAPKILFEGHVYVKQKALANGKVSYECEKRRAKGQDQGQCKAKIQVLGDQVVGQTNEHTHAPIPGRGDALKVKIQIKRRAVDTEETAQQIIAQTVEHVGQGKDSFILYFSL